MISSNFYLPASTRQRTGYSMPSQAQNVNAHNSQVRFTSSSANDDMAFLQDFFDKSPNVKLPKQEELDDYADSAKYLDAIRKHQQKLPVPDEDLKLPPKYRDFMIPAGFLKEEDTSFEAERAALRRFIEFLHQDDEEEKNKTLIEAGFKINPKPKKKKKKVQEETPTPSAVTSTAKTEVPTQNTEAPKVQKPRWELGFDWAEEAASADAFVKQAEREAQQKPQPAKREDLPKQQPASRFGEGLRVMLLRKSVGSYKNASHPSVEELRKQ